MFTFRVGMLLSAILLASSANGETLGDIYRLAVENDHDYLAAKATYEAGLQDKKIGRAGLLPTIGASYTVYDSETETPDTEFTNATPISEATDSTILDSIEDSSGSTFEVTLSQPLFDMAKWHNYKSADFSTKISIANYHTAKQDLIVRVADTYFNVLRATDLFTTAKTEEEASKSQLDQTKKRFEVGLTAITDVHEAQAVYDSARARRLSAEGQVGIAFEALEVITGQATAVISPLSDSFPIVPPTPVDRKKWEEFALENNFSLNAAQLRAKQSKENAKSSRAGHMPTVTANLGYTDRSGDSSSTANPFFPDIPTGGDFENNEKSASIRVNIPLFSGGGTNAQRKKSYQLYYADLERYNKALRDTTQRARTAHLTVLTDVATVQARQQAITSSRSAYEATKAGYEVGTRDLVDVLNAQRTLYLAQSNYSDALYTYIINTLNLKAVAGLLSDKDIDDLDKYLDKARQVVRDATPLAFN